MKTKKCVVCGLKNTNGHDKVCKSCLEYYKRKFGLKKDEELLNHKEFNELIDFYIQHEN